MRLFLHKNLRRAAKENHRKSPPMCFINIIIIISTNKNGVIFQRQHLHFENWGLHKKSEILHMWREYLVCDIVWQIEINEIFQGHQIIRGKISYRLFIHDTPNDQC